MEKSLKLYKLVDGENTPFPNATQQAILHELRFDAKRMGNVPTISATIMHPLCLDNLWGNDLVYVVYNDEKYFLKQTPTSSYSNEDTRYKHEVEFVSERIVLNNVYFYDVVQGDANVDKPVSNSSDVTFFGDIHELARRLNYSLQYANVDYRVVVDAGISSEAKLVSFKDQFVANALQESYNTYNIPYYYVGKVIHIGYANNDIEHTFKYGIDNALLSITKANANYKVVNRVTGIGSADNIPYYYPNKDEKGDSKALYNGEVANVSITNEILYRKAKLSDVFTYKNIAKYINVITDGSEYNFDNELTETEKNIWEIWQVCYPFTIDKISDYVTFNIDYYANDLRFINIELWNGGQRIATHYKVGEFTRVCGLGDYEIRIGVGIYSEEEHLPKSYAETIIGDIGVEVTQEIDSEVGWYLNDKKNNIVKLEDYGLSISTTPQDGDKITFKQYSYIKPQTNLMPPIYRESLGDERFYNAINNTYVNPETKDFYLFENPFVDGKPKEHIVNFEDIKPSIVGMTNGEGLRIDMFSEFAWDENDSDEFDEEGNYIHPYFFAKLRRFDGDFGFNLFDHSIEEDEMVISMTSGNCGGCNFVIGVDDETQRNTVQVDEDGNLKRDSNGNVLYGSPQERQNDTSKYEVWIALKKDIDTFGVIMPNATNNYKPKAEDTFVILHIDLPQSYIKAAENRLKEEIIKYMAMNNSEKFTFSITFSRIFFAQNPYILSQLNENSRLKIEYNNSTYLLYVSSYSYSVTNDNPLPEIRVELSDTLTIAQNAIQNAINEVKTDIVNRIENNNWVNSIIGYFLRKDVDDRSKGRIASDSAIEVGKFVSGVSGAIIYVDKSTGQTIAEIDKLFVRMKAHFEQLEVVNGNSVGGKQIISPAGALQLSNVVDNGKDYYRCYFLNEQDGDSVENRFRVGDQAYCQRFNAKSGVYNNISNKYYWRLVVGVGDDYIDLSKSDCDEGSDIPSVDDIICHRGNRNDVDRQNVIEFSSVDNYSPSIILYQGINSYSLVGKDIVSFGVDKTTNRPFMNVYGDMYVGDRNNTSYMRYTPENGLEIKGKLAVGTKLSDGRDLEQAINEATPEGYEEFVEEVTKGLESLQQQVDGAIESYFLEYDATLTNYPASEWDTDEEKQAHLGDTFTNNISGDSWRWGLDSSGNYAWIYISDTATKKALETASKAQDTADGKRRVFIEQPTPPYDLGDLWAGGSKMPLKRCIVAKDKGGSFADSDWDYADSTQEQLAGYEYLKRALSESTTVEGGLVQSSLLMLGYTKDGVFNVMSGTNGLYDTTAKGGGIAAWYGGPMADKEADSALVEYAQSLFRFDGSGYLAGGKISWDKDGAGKVANGGLSWDKNGVITLGESIKISGDNNETLGSILGYLNEILSFIGLDDNGDVYIKPNGDTPRNFYSYGEVSSFGLGTEGDGTGGVTALTALNDVNISNPTDGQSLVYDLASGKWVNKTVSGGISQVTIKLGTASYDSVNGVVALPAYPTALKNPYALTFGSKTYDGSATKTITASDLGALTTHQTIYALTINNSAGTAQVTYTPNSKAASLTLTKAMVGLGNVENTALSTWTGSAKITTLGTITSGTWNGSKIANSYLANSAMTIAGTSVSLGGSITAATLKTNLGLGSLAYKSNLVASDIPSLDWSKITSGKPTTLAGYGITDALPLSGGTIKGNVLIQGDSAGLLQINRQSTTSSTYITFLGNNSLRGRIGFNSSNQPIVQDVSISSDNQLLIHSGNIGSYAFIPRADILISNVNADHYWSNGAYLNQTGNGSGNSNFPNNYAMFLSFNNGASKYVTQFDMGKGAAYYRTKIDSWSRWYQFITDKDIGSQSVNYANSAGLVGYSSVANLTHTALQYWFDWRESTGIGVPGSAYKWGIHIGSPDSNYNFQIGATSQNNGLYARFKNGGTVYGWKELAFTDSNVASAQNLTHSNGTLGATVASNGNVLIGTTTDIGSKLYVAGDITATGEVASGSDARYKTIKSYVDIDIETIANAPIINFKWNDREDDKIHLGSTAQYWYNTALCNGVTPTDDEKLWTMGYGQIALASVVSVAKKVVNHEERIAALEKENKELKLKLERYGIQ